MRYEESNRDSQKYGIQTGMRIVLDTCWEAASVYPEVTLETKVVGILAMNLVMKPQKLDLIVTTNMFGDILTDEAAGLVGVLGMAPSL